MEKNLSPKVVTPRIEDFVKNSGGGSGPKRFGEFDKELQDKITGLIRGLSDYYSDYFEESAGIPAVAKLIVKEEAIAKSHKPNELCKELPIIGSGDLAESFIKITPDSLDTTIHKINEKAPSKTFQANMTTVESIEPYYPHEKISEELAKICDSGDFANVFDRIKVTVFNLRSESENSLLESYVRERLETVVGKDSVEIIEYLSDMRFFRVNASDAAVVNEISQINGIRNIDFFQQYSSLIEQMNRSLTNLIGTEESVSVDTVIGIIDGGISKNNDYIEPCVIERIEFVAVPYINPLHGTFIASTIQYGNVLNGIDAKEKRNFQFLDVAAMPNGDSSFGPTDSIGEIELVEITKDVLAQYSGRVKVWNFSLGLRVPITGDSISDLGAFLDRMQGMYDVQFFVAVGNMDGNDCPLRTRENKDMLGGADRIISPADSVRSISVGSIALNDSDDSYARAGEPSPFSRRGPGANYVVKPDLVDYGGNCGPGDQTGLQMIGLDNYGEATVGIGTSYATPRVVQKYASIFDELETSDILLSKALLIHSARMNSREWYENEGSRENYDFYGFGMPAVDASSVLDCQGNEMTLIFKSTVFTGQHLDLYDFPYPRSLIKNGKCRGEIAMTLVYDPPLDQGYGQEYCRTDLDASFGVYGYKPDGRLGYSSKVPLEKAWADRYEKKRVENGLKWNPVKSYYRKIPQGINIMEGWRLTVEMTARNGVPQVEQGFVLILTIRGESDTVYLEMTEELEVRNYLTQDLRVRHRVQARN